MVNYLNLKTKGNRNMGSKLVREIKKHIEDKRKTKNLRNLFRESGESNVPPAIPPLMVKIDGEMVIDPSLNLDKPGTIERHTMEEISLDK